MIDNEKILQLAQKHMPFDLPIGIYIVTRDGKFIECNKLAREILNLPLEGSINASITDFYQNPKQREELIAELEQAEKKGKWLEKKIIPFKINKQEIFVQDSCRSIRDPETSEIIGYIGCLTEVTREEHYRQLFERLPAGVYQLDEYDVIAHVNKAAFQMLGYDSERELIDKPVKSLYANAEEAETLRKLTIEKNFVVDQKVELLKKTGETIFVSVNTFKLTAVDGSYAGREGTITDVTTEERYHRILEDVPVGFYMVRVENGEDLIRHCNKQFANMFDFDKEEGVIGLNIKELYYTREDYPEFMEAIKQKDSVNQPLLGYALKVRTKSGKDMVIEVNSRLLHDRQGNIIGRVGVVRDITEEAGLRDRVKEFTDDIGSVLHDYTATLSSVQLLINAVMQSFGPDPFEGKRALLPEQAACAIQVQTAILISSFNKLLELAKSEERSTALVTDKWNELSNLLQLLKALEQIPYLEFRPPTVRYAAYKILEICTGIEEEKKFPKEAVREVKKDARELMRICSFVALHQALSTIIAMDPQVRSLREYVTLGARTRESKSVCKIGTIIYRAVANSEEFAKNEGVNIKFKIENPDEQIEVIERDVIRALSNLLHNAIKYSWNRKEGEPPWILIRSRIDQNQVWIEVENWGVPIPKDEIDKGLIFQIGYRGRLSSDRGRVGTGVGLADARRVARAHNGEVIIKSHPAHPGGKENDYKQAFLTIATLKLPISIVQGVKK